MAPAMDTAISSKPIEMVATKADPIALRQAYPGLNGYHGRHHHHGGHGKHHGRNGKPTKTDDSKTNNDPKPDNNSKPKEPVEEPKPSVNPSNGETTNPPPVNGNTGETDIVQRTFDCRVPQPPRNFSRSHDPIPIPEKLTDIISWTDAFVERIGELVTLQQNDTDLAYIDLIILKNAAERARDIAVAERDQYKERAEIAEDKALQYKYQLDILIKGIEGLDKISDLTKQIDDLTKELVEANNGRTAAESKLDELTAINISLRARITALEGDDTDDKTHIKTLEDENAGLQVINADLKALSEALQTQVSDLKDLVATLQSDKAGLQSENESLKNQVNTLEEENSDLKLINTDLKDLADSLGAENSILKDRISALEENDSGLQEKYDLLDADYKRVQRLLMEKSAEADYFTDHYKSTVEKLETIRTICGWKLPTQCEVGCGCPCHPSE